VSVTNDRSSLRVFCRLLHPVSAGFVDWGYRQPAASDRLHHPAAPRPECLAGPAVVRDQGHPGADPRPVRTPTCSRPAWPGNRRAGAVRSPRRSFAAWVGSTVSTRTPADPEAGARYYLMIKASIASAQEIYSRKHIFFFGRRGSSRHPGTRRSSRPGRSQDPLTMGKVRLLPRERKTSWPLPPSSSSS